MKLQSIFVSYLLLPIVAIILIVIFFLINKKNSIVNTKSVIIACILFSLLIALPSIFTFTGVRFIGLYYPIIQIVYLFFGYYYLMKLESFFTDKDSPYVKPIMILISIIILCIGSFLFSLFFNYFGELHYGLIASTCTYTFILPLFVDWAYKALLNIPSGIFKIWKYNNAYNESVFSSEAVDKIIVLELELSKQVENEDNIKVKAKAPLNFQFGDWFQMFIHDHNIKYAEKPISYKTNNIPDGWIFYTKPTFVQGKKYIDHEKTIEENQLTNENTTIICKRVSITNH
jgi:hypothetical protein